MPNPTTSYFTLVIQGSSDRPASIRVSDAAGRIVEARNGISINTTLRLGAAYRKGIYVVEVVQGSERMIMKLVKVSK